MTNRGWQRISQVLGVLLVVLVAAAAVVVLTRPSPAGRTASPTRLAAISANPSAGASASPKPSASARASASASPAISPSASPKPSPSPSPQITASPSASATPSVSATPSASATIAPTAPIVAIRFKGLGYDGQSAATQTPRTITFRSEGPGQVGAHLGRTSGGDVRLCLGRKGSTQTCIEANKADLTDASAVPGKVIWVVTAIGIGPASPIADLRIVFRSTKPGVTLDGFRFQGTQNPGYNGVEADFDVGTGSVHATGQWGGAVRSWRATLTDPQAGGALGDASGRGNDLLLDAAVTPRRVHLSLTNTELLAAQEVFLHAVIRWP